MTKTLQQIIGEQMKEFEEHWETINSAGSLWEEERSWFITTLLSVACQTAENLRVEKKQGEKALGWEELTQQDFGYNAALTEIESKEKEFFKELS